MDGQCRNRGERHADRVPIQDAWIRVDLEVRPKGREETPTGLHRDSTNHVSQCCPEEHGEHQARDAESRPPKLDPKRMVHVVLKLDAQGPEGEEPHDDNQRQVESTERRREQHGKPEEDRPSRREEPDFVSVPYRPDATHDATLFVFGFGDKEVQDASTEVEAIQDHVARDEKGDEHVPHAADHSAPPGTSEVSPAAGSPFGEAPRSGPFSSTFMTRKTKSNEKSA